MGWAASYDLGTMGQDVAINSKVMMGNILIIDTDRSFTGQDGQIITPELDGSGVPGDLASRLFDLDLGVDHVFVLQNTVTVRRTLGWDESATSAVADVTQTFLRYYDEEE